MTLSSALEILIWRSNSVLNILTRLCRPRYSLVKIEMCNIYTLPSIASNNTLTLNTSKCENHLPVRPPLCHILQRLYNSPLIGCLLRPRAF